MGPAPDPAFAELAALVPRRHFLPADQQRYADQDRPLPIGHESTNSQPSTVARMLSLLQVRSGDRVLDVGAGSGWTTCLLASLAGPDGSVHGVELNERVAAFGAGNVARWMAGPGADGAPVQYHLAEQGELGWPDGAPYDRILVSAMAERMPPELVNQLAQDGVMVLPIDGRMARVRCADPEPIIEYAGWYRFVPLR